MATKTPKLKAAPVRQSPQQAVTAKSPPTTAVAVKQATELVAPSEISAFDLADNGFENVTARDLLIPRLTILQALSPQVVPSKAEYDPEARVGEIYDVGLQERFPDGIIFLPVYYVKSWLEWAPRNTGKGLQHIHEDESILLKTERDDKNRPILDNGNYIAETAQFYGLNVSADFRKSFIPMTSTQLKKARRLLTLSTSEKVQRPNGTEFTPPLFYRTYSLTTVPENNNEGDWMGWKVERGEALMEYPRWQSILDDVKQFRAQLADGTIRGDVSAMESEVNSTPRDDAAM